MRPSEQYDRIIQKVEEAIHAELIPKSRDIASGIAKEAGIGYREFNAIFTFLSGKSFLDYIGHRRMMLAYEMIVESDRLNLDEPIFASGYETGSSFDKEFKRVFGQTPKEAFAAKNKNIIEQPLTWDRIAVTEDKEPKIVRKEERMDKPFLGTTKEHVDMLSRALDFQVLYRFNDRQTNAAYLLAERHGLDMKKAFDFVEEYCRYWHDDGDGNFDETIMRFDEEELVKEDELIYACVKLGLRIGEALAIRDELRPTRYGLKDLNESIIEMSGKPVGLSFRELIKLDKMCPGDVDFECMVYEVSDGMTPEEAIESQREQMYGDIEEDPNDLDELTDWDMFMNRERNFYTGELEDMDDYNDESGSYDIDEHLDDKEDW